MGRDSRPADALVEALMGRVRAIVAKKASSPAHAAGLAKELFEQRAAFDRAVTTVRCVEKLDEHQLFLREFRRCYYLHRERLAAVDGRSELIGEWTHLLVLSLNRVQDELDSPQTEGPTPFHALLDEDDLAIMEIDSREDGDLGGRAIAESWLA